MTLTTDAQIEILDLNRANPLVSAADGQDAIQGLMQHPKSLPAKYFYDDQGSQLFEQICELPEYYPTRTEAWILRQYANEIAQATGPCELVELGSGSSTKTRQLLTAYQALGQTISREEAAFKYRPIDVSGGILTQSAHQLLQDYPTLQIQGLVGTYDQALAHLQAAPQMAPARMIFFLGSSLGNLTPAGCDRFFCQILNALEAGDYFLLGVDLQKPKPILETAYNDAQGVTAQFNLNMLAHLNRRFAGNFELQHFEHQAFYNEQLHQIEMHLSCTQACKVQLRHLNLVVELEAGETIQTEISRKFDLGAVQSSLQNKGLQPLKTWTDPQQWFGLVLAQKV